MTYLGTAALVAAVGIALGALLRRRSLSLVGGVIGGLCVGVAHAQKPTLFLAENGPWLTVPLFSLPATLVGLIVGLVGQRAVRALSARSSARHPPNER